MLRHMRFGKSKVMFSTLGNNYETAIDLNSREYLATDLIFNGNNAPRVDYQGKKYESQQKMLMHAPVPRLQVSEEQGSSVWAMQFRSAEGISAVCLIHRMQRVPSKYSSFAAYLAECKLRGAFENILPANAYLEAAER